MDGVLEMDNVIVEVCVISGNYDVDVEVFFKCFVNLGCLYGEFFGWD